MKLLGSAFSVRLNDCLENTSSEDSKAVRERERERERESERERERQRERERERETQTERERVPKCRLIRLESKPRQATMFALLAGMSNLGGSAFAKTS